MTCVSRLCYSPMYEVSVDLTDMWCADVSKANKHANYGKHIPMIQVGNYLSGKSNCLLLHRVVADACVFNPRPDIFVVSDHIDGNTLNNKPSNLRWVNQHLNLLNRHYDHDTQTPAGLSVVRYNTKNGKTFKLWRFKKGGRPLKYWSIKWKKEACEFADDFNLKYFNALYQAYLHSPQDGNRAEWRKYWRSYFISNAEFRKKDRSSVLALQKFVVGDELFRKMCVKI